MPKRLTDTELWKKPWFRKLPPEYKSFWYYLLSNCDNAGVWEEDFEIASFTIGQNIDPTLARNLFSEKIIFLENGKKWLIKSFINFQNGENLSLKSPIHKKIFDLLKKHKIDYQKLKEIQNNTQGPTLGPKVDAMVVEGDIDIEREGEGEGEREREGERGREGGEKAQSAVLPFPSEDFSNAWKAWKAYKESQFKFWYKTVDTEQIALKQLSELASGEEQTAIKIIQQSIANGWKGFFELKSKQAQNDGKYTAEDYQQLGNTIDEWFDRKYGV